MQQIYKSVLLEGTIRSYKGEWILETYDHKLYRIQDLFDPFSGSEVRLIIADLQDLEDLKNTLTEDFTHGEQEGKEEG